jgi:DNA-binding NtrC family response regulator
MSEKKVLIVDDDKSITTVYRRILEEQGYNVHTASSGKEARALSPENAIRETLVRPLLLE